jgi:hypothetical protein
MKYNVVVIQDSNIFSKQTVLSLVDIFNKFPSGTIVKFYRASGYEEVSLESLCNNQIVSATSSSISYQFQNYMQFLVTTPNAVAGARQPADPSLKKAFYGKLQGSGVSERDRLWSYIIWANNLLPTGNNMFYARIINVCQSSGSGKSKIAKELMTFCPSAYVVLRKQGEGAYPNASKLSSMFLLDKYNFPNKYSDQLIVRYYGVLLNEVLAYYNVQLEKWNRGVHQEVLNVNESDTVDVNYDERSSKRQRADGHSPNFLSEMCASFIDGKFHPFDGFVSPPSIMGGLDSSNLRINQTSRRIENCSVVVNATDFDAELERACAFHVEQILMNIRSSGKGNAELFLFILDEASLLTEVILGGQVNLFRLFRRSLNQYFFGTKFFVLTLGTNSDVLDLNPSFTSDSHREKMQAKPFPPFILSRNWDIMLNVEDLLVNKIGYDSLQCGRLCLFHASLGRPLFSSVALGSIPLMTETKLINNSLNTGETYLACWMVRVGLTVNPSHIVCKYLTKSLMARLVYFSDNLRNMRVEYPSEPMLAFAARRIIHNFSDRASPFHHLLHYYEMLEYYIQSRAIDYGRMSEIIFGDILLQAVAKSDRIQMKTWLYVEGLPQICKRQSFLFNDNNEPSGKETDDDATVCHAFENFGTTITVDSFIKSLFGNVLYEELITYIPFLLHSALINASHFVQVTRKFPYEDVVPIGQRNVVADEASKERPVADSRFAGGNESCNILTQQILETGMMRSNAFLCPPNYFGEDIFLPCCLDPDMVAGRSAVTNTPIVVRPGTVATNYGDICNNRANITIRRDLPTYSCISSQIKKSSNYGNKRKVITDCALSNHLVRCALHQQCDGECAVRIPDNAYSQILGNGLAFLHVMEAKPFRTAAGDCVVEINNEVLWNNRNKLKKHNQRDRASKKVEAARALFEDLCPDALRSIYHAESTTKDKWPQNIDAELRFVPDIYISKTLSKYLTVHFMAKKYPDRGLVERLTVIESRGLEVFQHFFPENVAKVAHRIIFNEMSIFNEFHNQQNTVKYQELIQSVVHTNNDSSIPHANNYIRQSMNMPLIPNLIPEYNKISVRDIDMQLT